MFRSLRRLNFGLPLLAKELLEQSARPRTYIVRSAYAALLFTAAIFIFYDEMKLGFSNALPVLGRGKQIFEGLLELQFIGIYLFMPAITCAVFTQEKENNTLPLLLLTRLGPGTILMEKYASRTQAMLGFILMSLPLCAYAYSLGGMSLRTIVIGLLMLVLTVFQIGAISLACSAWCRTTFSAFISSYAVSVAFICAPFLLFVSASLFSNRISLPVLSGWAMQGKNWGTSEPFSNSWSILFPCFAPMQLFAPEYNPRTFSFDLTIPTGRTNLEWAVCSLPNVVSTLLFLGFARVFLLRRMMVQGTSALQIAFRKLDEVFHRWNQGRLGRGVVLIKSRTEFPDDQPVAWRETAKRSLGQARYLIRLVLGMEIGFWTLLVALALFTQGEGQLFVAVLAWLMWLISVLLVAVISVVMIAGERGRQTLDVLCVTPITGREIVLQKFTAVRRLIYVLWIPLGTMIVVEGRTGFQSLILLLAAVLYLPLAGWLSMWVGLKVKNRIGALVTSVAVIAVWCVAPIVFIYQPISLMFHGVEPNAWLSSLMLLSPASITVMMRSNLAPWNDLGFMTLATLINFTLYGGACLFIRRACLTQADRLLGRIDCDRGAVQETPSPEQPTPALAKV